MKIKKVFSKRLAYELRQRGCKFIGIEANKYKPEFNVYLFEQNEHLTKAWEEINGNN